MKNVTLIPVKLRDEGVNSRYAVHALTEGADVSIVGHGDSFREAAHAAVDAYVDTMRELTQPRALSVRETVEQAIANETWLYISGTKADGTRYHRRVVLPLRIEAGLVVCYTSEGPRNFVLGRIEVAAGA